MVGAKDWRAVLIIVSALVLMAAAAVVLMGSHGAPETVNTTPQEPAAQAVPPPQIQPNATAEATPPPPPPAPAPSLSSESIGQLLDDGLARADSRFQAVKGPYVYDVGAYRWRMSGSDSDPPDLLPVRKNDLNASVIRFPDRYIDSLRGYAFKTYQPQQLAGPMKLFGVAVFLADSTPLDAFVNGTAFDMTYDPHPELSQTLEGCRVLNSTVLETPTGSNIKVYDFSCRLIYGASP
jgi:hypothetical protein